MRRTGPWAAWMARMLLALVAAMLLAPATPAAAAEPELADVVVAPPGWPVRRHQAPPFGPDDWVAQLIGEQEQSWIQAEHIGVYRRMPGSMVVRAYRFDTSEHAEAVWKAMGDLNAETLYTYDGVADTYAYWRDGTVRPSDIFSNGTSVHEAFRLLGPTLVVFSSIAIEPYELPDATLKQFVEHHVAVFPPVTTPRAFPGQSGNGLGVWLALGGGAALALGLAAAAAVVIRRRRSPGPPPPQVDGPIFVAR